MDKQKILDVLKSDSKKDINTNFSTVLADHIRLVETDTLDADLNEIWEALLDDQVTVIFGIVNVNQLIIGRQYFLFMYHTIVLIEKYTKSMYTGPIPMSMETTLPVRCSDKVYHFISEQLKKFTNKELHEIMNIINNKKVLLKIY